jgi:hypothetical protein
MPCYRTANDGFVKCGHKQVHGNKHGTTVLLWN